jgi:hypothetical protein
MRHNALLAVGLVGMLGAALAGCTGQDAPPDEKFNPPPPPPSVPRLERWSDADWAAVLATVCTPDGFVRYDALVDNVSGCRAALARYVAAIRQVSPRNRPELFPGEGARLAYWVNAYNALAMHAALERNVPASAAKIPYVERFTVGGVPMTLEMIEKHEARGPGDPRVHFALNGMSASAPPLLNEPYDGARLDAQFDAQGRRYLGDPRGAQRAGDGRVRLSEVFTKFYPRDWKDAQMRRTGKRDPGLIESLRPYAAPDSPVQTATEYESMDYDWSLNRAR